MNILFVVPRCPWPPYVGQSRLAFHRAKTLKSFGHTVTLYAYGNDIISKTSFHKDKLSSAFHNIRLYDIPFVSFFLCFLSSSFPHFFGYRSIIASGFSPPCVCLDFEEFLSSSSEFDIVHFYSIRSSPLWSIVNSKSISFVVDLVDSLSLNMSRKYNNSNLLFKLLFAKELVNIIHFERNLIPYEFCLSYLTVGQIDLSYLSLALPESDYAPGLNFCPIGVESFPVSFSGSVINGPSIIFFGTLSYAPNIEAIDWLLSSIMPFVWQFNPSLLLYILGSNPSRPLVNRCLKFSNVRLVPNPESIAPYLLSSSCSLAPMKSGSGQQFKIIESLANGIPVVSTSLAANPLDLLDSTHLFIADDSLSFANSINRILSNPSAASEVTSHGTHFVLNRFSWSASTNTLLSIYGN
jgi:glycosyltransferase involved in cell wall biosynthesis